jgi:hypothetical protein
MDKSVLDSLSTPAGEGLLALITDAVLSRVREDPPARRDDIWQRLRERRIFVTRGSTAKLLKLLVSRGVVARDAWGGFVEATTETTPA